jgi:hypothetical protein
LRRPVRAYISPANSHADLGDEPSGGFLWLPWS